MILSAHFTLAELTTTNTGLDNTPTRQEIAQLTLLAAFLEKIRHLLNDLPIAINSAFRSQAVNAAVGGVSNSAHRLGYAADFTCEEFGTPLQIAQALDTAGRTGVLVFDQLIYEGTWVHISRDPRARMQRLTKRGASYDSGITAP